MWVVHEGTLSAGPRCTVCMGAGGGEHACVWLRVRVCVVIVLTARAVCVGVLSQVECMQLSGDGSTLITGDRGKSAIVWDLSTGERKSTMKADGSVRLPCGAVCSCSRECGVFSCFVCACVHGCVQCVYSWSSEDVRSDVGRGRGWRSGRLSVLHIVVR